MGLNSRVSKIPFFLLYLTVAILTLFNWIRVILFQKDFEVFLTEQPWDYYLSKFFTSIFGITHQQYFIFALPVVLVILYVATRVFGKLLNLDKKTNIKGDNHIAIILILLIAPVAFGIHKLLGPGWKNHFVPGLILVIIFSILSWIDEKNIS